MILVPIFFPAFGGQASGDTGSYLQTAAGREADGSPEHPCPAPAHQSLAASCHSRGWNPNKSIRLSRTDKCPTEHPGPVSEPGNSDCCSPAEHARAHPSERWSPAPWECQHKQQ